MKLTALQRDTLKLYKPHTYAICLGAIGPVLEKKGLVEWVPPIWGNENNWAITDLGRQAAAEI